MVTEIHGYVFVQDHLDNFEHAWEGTELCNELGDRIGDVLSATDLAERIKLNLEDPEALSAKEVTVLTNLSKAQIIKEVDAIKEKANRLKKESGVDLGAVIVLVGFVLKDYEGTYNPNQHDLLEEAGAPLSETSIARHWHITYCGEVLCFNQLIADLTTGNSITATLIHQYDNEMR